MSKLVKVTFNGIEVEVPEGMGLVEAAAQAGVEIPIFCHHHKLDPVGVCRMCLVEVEGQRKPVTACTMRATDGLVVHTETDLIKHLRQGCAGVPVAQPPIGLPRVRQGRRMPAAGQYVQVRAHGEPADHGQSEETQSGGHGQLHHLRRRAVHFVPPLRALRR